LPWLNLFKSFSMFFPSRSNRLWLLHNLQKLTFTRVCLVLYYHVFSFHYHRHYDF
jgi:hypothetical protein